MTLRTPPPARVALGSAILIALALLTFPAAAGAAKGKRRAEKRPQATRAASGRAARGRAPKTSARVRRSARRGDNQAQDKRGGTKRAGRALTRRERLAEARREAERRRRERLEALRRAEQARQAALARRRAMDQAFRDETVASILRDETTGEDLEVRRAAVAALGGRAGTVVVMDPKTGRIYTIVNQEWAVRRGFKPCSTMKLVTGLAGLSEQVISPVQTVQFSGANYDVDLTDALAYSVPNSYFQAIGGRVGFERMMVYARELGFGERTGINHANEYAGRLPVYKTGYAVNHMSSHGDDFAVTPVQLISLVSAIANGGSLLVPHLPRTPEENVTFKTETRRRLSVPPEMLRRLIPGMIGAVNYGSGKLAYDPAQTVAGKTGSCVEDGSWVGLFASYAPVTDPRLAVVVVVRGSGARGRLAASIAGNIYRALNQRFGKTVNAPLANAPGEGMPAPRPKMDPKVAAALSAAEEKEDAAEEANENNGGTETTVKSVLKPVPSPRPDENRTSPAAAPSAPASKPGSPPHE